MRVRSRLYRLGLFVLLMALTSAFAGAMMSGMAFSSGQQRASAILLATGICILASYALAYRPGWAFNYLAGPKEGRHGGDGTASQS